MVAHNGRHSIVSNARYLFSNDNYIYPNSNYVIVILSTYDYYIHPKIFVKNITNIHIKINNILLL